MTGVRYVLLLILASLLCVSCAQQHTLVSESGLYDVQLRRSIKISLNGAWSWGRGNPYLNQKEGSIYIAPLDISKVEKDEPELAPLMVPQMQHYMVESLGKALREGNEANKHNWTLTDDPTTADIRVDMALVHFRPQYPVLRILSKISGNFIKVPGVTGVVGKFAEGDICIELTIRDVKTGQLLFACKDSNRKAARLISADAYKRTGNADVNLRSWAERLGKLIRYCSPDMLGDGILSEKIQNRPITDVITDRLSL